MSLCYSPDLDDKMADFIDGYEESLNFSDAINAAGVDAGHPHQRRKHLNRHYADFQTFYERFQPISKYLCLALCLIGVLANGVTIVVLTRRRMKSTANRVLTLIAVFDLILMISYTIFLIHSQYLKFECMADGLSFSWNCFYLTHANLSIFCKACSLCSTVVLAIYRRRVLASSKSIVTDSVTSMDIVVTKMLTACFAGVLIFCLPMFANYTLVEETVPQHVLGVCPNGTVVYSIRPNDFADRYDCFLMKFNFWVSGLLFKFVPCSIIAYCLIWIILLMIKQSKRRQRQFRLKNYHNITNNNDNIITRRNAIKNDTQRATLILTLILTLTLLCELPCAVVSVLAGIFDKDFFKYVYRNLGDFFDALSLLNGFTTFTLYCFMNAGFRETFVNIFLPCRRQPVVKLPVSTLTDSRTASV